VLFSWRIYRSNFFSPQPNLCRLPLRSSATGAAPSPVRGEIAVETHPKTFSSSVRCGIFHPSPADVAPDGASDFTKCQNYKYAAPTALGLFSLVALRLFRPASPFSARKWAGRLELGVEKAIFIIICCK
jgi:hypothetical protein